MRLYIATITTIAPLQRRALQRLLASRGGREQVYSSPSRTNNIWGLRNRNVYVGEAAASRPGPRASQPSPSVPGVEKIPALVPESGIDPLSSTIYATTVGGLKRFSRRVRQTCTVVVSVDSLEPRLQASIDEVTLRVAMRAKPRSFTAVQRRTSSN